MEPTTFRLRRVLAGVVVGLVLVTLAGYGWVQYRTAQYHHRVDALVKRYHAAYLQCLADGGVAADCAARVTAACARDGFWARANPYDFVPGTGSTDAAARCASATLR
jgi:hypothetical protein